MAKLPEKSNRKDFEASRSTFSGKAVLSHWKEYYHIYGVLFLIYLISDISRNLHKSFPKWKQKRVNRFKRKWQYRPVKTRKYAQWLDYLHTSKKEFVDFTTQPYVRHENDTKVYAFYLTQFHAIPENDHAHGKGFTEWTNVANATPQFIGHYQPKIPYDLGFYNLLMPGVIERQVVIAKTYGIYGFCFYYYWFSGKKLLEKPLEYFLNSNIDFHFHLCWATENWSKQWDGGDKEIIVEQHLQIEDAEKFFSDILPYISDSRYEMINGKPLLIVYRPDIFDRATFNLFFNKLNNLAIAHGFEGFYLMCTNAFGFDKPFDYSCVGQVEFPPHGIFHKQFRQRVSLLSEKSVFTISNHDYYIENGLHRHTKEYPIFKTCFPGWDNTPRKLYSNGHCFLLRPEYFKQWLKDNIIWTREHHDSNEQIVYINAWNEWAEGAVLEPNTFQGYQNLQIVKEVLEDLQDK